jgi:hypothetical protein
MQLVAEQLGFDEGGVFESLRDPVFSQVKTVTKFRHNKEGLVTSEITTVTKMQLTGSQALAIAVGPPLVALLAGRPIMKGAGDLGNFLKDLFEKGWGRIFK